MPRRSFLNEGGYSTTGVTVRLGHITGSYMDMEKMHESENLKAG